jgi:hypothetical protein
MDLTGDFEQIIALCEELEQAPPMGQRVKRRIANAYTHAVGKACVLGWYAKTEPERITDDAKFRNTVMRHAERGARNFIP